MKSIDWNTASEDEIFNTWNELVHSLRKRNEGNERTSYYVNMFTGCTRKFENGVGYVLNADAEWVKNKTSESLIKSLPYYRFSPVL